MPEVARLGAPSGFWSTDMIRGAHMIIYTKDPEADRAFFRDVLEWPYVDAHEGWLIFKMPPSELACHPLMNGETHEIYLMSDNVTATAKTLTEKGHACSDVRDEGFGKLKGLFIQVR